MKLLTEYLRPGTVIFRNREFSASEISAGIDEVARYLSNNLRASSPFVYLYASNHLKTVLAFFGIIKARRICVVVDPEIGSLELAEMMADTPPAASIRFDEQSVEWNFTSEIIAGSTIETDKFSDDLNDVCMLMYTAAADGIAKAAMLTHENLYLNAAAIVDGNLLGPESVTMAVLPFSHAFGLQTGVVTPNICGGTTVIIEKRDFSSGTQILQPIASFDVTHVYSVPVVYYLLGKLVAGGRWRSELKKVRSCISGGYALTDFIRDRLFESTEICIRQGYGLTEASPVCSWVFPDVPQRTNSIGKSIECCEMKIVTADAPVASIPVSGEIAIRGSNVMKGYFNQPEASSEVLRNGWLFTGDIGHQDDDGYFYFDRTKKRMINYAGVKVYPAEVERLMMTNQQVESAKVYGVKNYLVSEVVHADLLLKNNSLAVQSQFRSWMKENLTSYKIPKFVTFLPGNNLQSG